MTEQKEKDPSCQSERLLLYHYAELDAGERLAAERHLERCPACRAELAELRRLLKAVPAPDAELTPAEVQRFTAGVMERLPARRRPFRPLLGWTLAGAAALLITVNLGRQIPGDAPPPERSLVKSAAVTADLPDLALLQNLDLLDNYELLEQLDRLR